MIFITFVMSRLLKWHWGSYLMLTCVGLQISCNFDRPFSSLCSSICLLLVCLLVWFSKLFGQLLCHSYHGLFVCQACTAFAACKPYSQLPSPNMEYKTGPKHGMQVGNLKMRKINTPSPKHEIQVENLKMGKCKIPLLEIAPHSHSWELEWELTCSHSNSSEWECDISSCAVIKNLRCR